MQNYSPPPPILEITIISAQDLKRKAAVFTFPRRLRPFITIIAASNARGSSKTAKLYKTKVDDKGGVNPNWGDRFRISLDHTFFHQRYAGLYLRVYTKHLLIGQSHLGWCPIPAADLVSHSLPVGYTRFLSYRLRARDGSRGNGIVNIAVKEEGCFQVLHPPSASIFSVPNLRDMNEDQMVTGMPVKF